VALSGLICGFIRPYLWLYPAPICGFIRHYLRRIRLYLRSKTALKTLKQSDAAAALAGCAFAAYGFHALLSIPHDVREFRYAVPRGGSALWPLPFAPLNGFTPEQLSSHVARVLFLLPACVLLGFALRGIRPPRVSRLSPYAAMALGVAATLAVATVVIRGVPLQDDDATYLMQAELLSRGLVADPTYPPSRAFPEPFTIFTQRGMSGMYLFGTPLVLALGLPFHAPWLGQAVLVAVTLWCAFHAAARAGDRTVAACGTWLLALSPMLTFTSATFLSQPAALAGVAVAVLGVQIGDWRGGALIGTGIGFCFAARPQVAAPVGLALLVFYGWRDRRALVASALALLPWMAAVAANDQFVTGSVWHLPRFEYAGELESYGFGTVLRHYAHTPQKAAALAAVAVIRLNGWSLGWPCSLAGPIAWLVFRCPDRRAVGPWAVVALATFVYQAGYASIGTSETGPIYHYAALPFVAFATASALRESTAYSWGNWAAAFAVFSTLLGTSTFYVEHAMRVARLSRAIEGPRRSLPLDPPALVIEEVWGGRPQVGWVFGIPFRERSPSSPVIRFPRPAHSSDLEQLQMDWPDRHCSYLWFDWDRARYQLSPCRDTAAIAAAHPQQFAPDAERARDWKSSFPYLPLGDTADTNRRSR